MLADAISKFSSSKIASLKQKKTQDSLTEEDRSLDENVLVI